MISGQQNGIHVKNALQTRELWKILQTIKSLSVYSNKYTVQSATNIQTHTYQRNATEFGQTVLKYSKRRNKNRRKKNRNEWTAQTHFLKQHRLKIIVLK